MDAALDFGCSSGRVVRVLAAAYPESSWHGCDPNGRAIEWAAENLPGSSSSSSGDDPPLPLDDGSLDLAYAISIWSHFAPELGLQLVRGDAPSDPPGGHLVLTTHGLTSVVYYAELGLRAAEQSHEILDALYRQGWWYAPSSARGRLGRGQPRLGHRLPLARVGAHATLPALACP